MSDKQQEGTDLSVVIIAKNEEEMIADCIQSVLSALDYAKENGVIKTDEVILSDSASTDRTIEIAKKYPIKIVQLNKNWPLSASAGRYIGYLHTNGKYVFFTDGDCVLNKEWFIVAFPYLKDENVAAVDGFEREHIKSDNLFFDLFSASEEKVWAVTEVENVGKAIFKRAILNVTGVSNPYLIGAEDRDISYMITDAGYKLLRLPVLCVTHYWAKKDGNLTIKSYLKSAYVWSKGEGQAMRYSINNKKIVYKYLKRYINTFYIKTYVIIFLAISLIYMNILTILITPLIPILLSFTIFIDAILAGLGAMYAFIRYKGGKWNEFLFSFHVVLYVLIRHIGFVIGFLKRPKDPSTYPTDVEIIKE